MKVYKTGHGLCDTDPVLNFLGCPGSLSAGTSLLTHRRAGKLPGHPLVVCQTMSEAFHEATLDALGRAIHL